MRTWIIFQVALLLCFTGKFIIEHRSEILPDILIFWCIAAAPLHSDDDHDDHETDSPCNRLWANPFHSWLFFCSSIIIPFSLLIYSLLFSLLSFLSLNNQSN